jgi:hypothetical protein
VFTRDRIQSTSSESIFLRSTLLLSSRVRLSLPPEQVQSLVSTHTRILFYKAQKSRQVRCQITYNRSYFCLYFWDSKGNASVRLSVPSRHTERQYYRQEMRHWTLFVSPSWYLLFPRHQEYQHGGRENLWHENDKWSIQHKVLKASVVRNLWKMYKFSKSCFLGNGKITFKL